MESRAPTLILGLFTLVSTELIHVEDVWSGSLLDVHNHCTLSSCFPSPVLNYVYITCMDNILVVFGNLSIHSSIPIPDTCEYKSR